MIWIWIGITLIGLLLLGNLFTAVLQDFFIFRPSRLKEDFQYTFDYPFEERTLKTIHHGSINLVHFHQEVHRKKLILYCHGNTSNLDKWGDVHRSFTDAGYDFMMFDYRGFGKSKGVRTEANFHEDAKAIYAYALENYNASDIIIFGRSLGSGIATRLAADREHQALILETPFASMPFLFQSYYPFLPAALFIFKYQLDNIECFRRIKGEIYLFHGTRDKVVPLSSSLRLEKEFVHEKSELIILKKGKHGNLSEFDEYHERLNSLLAEFKN